VIETKPLKKIMKEYLSVLEKYEDKIDCFEQNDIKRLIGDIRLFWYRQKHYICYFLSNIDKEDNVTYLSGAVRLDIRNSGHKEYIIVKGCRLINDPLVKLSTFYRGTDSEINFEAANRYLKDCFFDMLVLLREYSEDFFLIPLESITITESAEYYKALNDDANQMLLLLFFKPYASIEEMKNDNSSYEDLERHLHSWIKERIVFDTIEDNKLSIEERCKKALVIGKKYIPFMETMSESELFFNLVNQHCMGAIATFDCMKNLRIMPYIRNDIAFQYFDLLFHSSINDEFDIYDYLKVFVPYIVQKILDFSKWDYEEVKQKIGEGILVDYIIDNIVFGTDDYPSVSDIVEKVHDYIKKLNMS
jgi:hypothetical protein